MTLDDFKDYGGTMLKERIKHSDLIDYDNGTAIIHSANISKYLEQFACKNADELSDALWYGHGIFLKVVRDD